MPLGRQTNSRAWGNFLFYPSSIKEQDIARGLITKVLGLNSLTGSDPRHYLETLLAKELCVEAYEHGALPPLKIAYVPENTILY